MDVEWRHCVSRTADFELWRLMVFTVLGFLS